jgi:lycopene beta-cyclase
VGGASVVAVSWPAVRVVGHREHEVARAYCALDNAGLQGWLAGRFRSAGGRVVVGMATGTQHFTWGSRLALDGQPSLAVGLVVDATGAPGRLLRRSRARPAGFQTAFGLFARFDRPPIPPGSCTLMDWSPAGPLFAGGDDQQTFLYALALGGGRFLVEETALAARPPVSVPELRRRLCVRLERLGATPSEVESEELVRIPLGGTPPRPQAVAATGAAAGLVHPATGYSVAAGLRVAPVLAAAVGRAFGTGADASEVADAAWSAVWSADRRRAARLERVGLSRFLVMDPDEVRAFFDAFFDLPVDRWSPYLSGRGSAADVARAMGAVFSASPGRVRRRLVFG